jgi:hypothetical protein
MSDEEFDFDSSRISGRSHSLMSTDGEVNILSSLEPFFKFEFSRKPRTGA